MEDQQTTERITLSISQPTNDILEEIQHHLRKSGSRHYKARIIHAALEHFAQGLGLEGSGAYDYLPGTAPEARPEDATA
jgi:hypothetical protein